MNKFLKISIWAMVFIAVYFVIKYAGSNPAAISFVLYPLCGAGIFAAVFIIYLYCLVANDLKRISDQGTSEEICLAPDKGKLICRYSCPDTSPGGLANFKFNHGIYCISISEIEKATTSYSKDGQLQKLTISGCWACTEYSSQRDKDDFNYHIFRRRAKMIFDVSNTDKNDYRLISELEAVTDNVKNNSKCQRNS